MKPVFIPAALTALLFSYAPPQMAQQAEELKATAQVTGPVKAEAPAHVALANLPQITAAEARAYRPAPRPHNPYFTDEQWKAVKAQAAQMPAVARPEEGVNPSAPSLPTASTGEVGIFATPQEEAATSTPPEGGGALTPGAFVDFNGGRNCGYVPSDMGVAVSGSWVVQVINACVYVYSKSGVLQSGFPKSLDSVLGWSASTFTFDPRVTYDFTPGRFIITAATEFSSTHVGYFNVAASATSDPRGTWHVYHLGQSNVNLVDFPTLGQNWANDPFDGAIYTCANLYFTSGAFTAKCLFLPKAAVYAGNSFSYNTASNFSYGGTTLDTIQPVNVFQPGEKPRAEFAVNALNTGGGGVCGGHPCNGLMIWAFANTLVQSGSPGVKISGIHVSTPSSYSEPANGDNAGFCNNCIDTGDNRISGMVQYSAGRIFPTINVGNGGTSAVLGWVIRPFLNDNGGGCTGSFTNACPTISGATVEQEFCDYCGAGHGGSAYYGAIATTEENNWTMFATYSSQSTSPGTFYTSNRVTWQKPLHDAGTFSCQLNNNYNGRWGDYSAAAPDIPGSSNQPAIWGSGMYVASTGSFGTCIAANRFAKVTDP